jgi:hypothetical protein
VAVILIAAACEDGASGAPGAVVAGVAAVGCGAMGSRLAAAVEGDDMSGQASAACNGAMAMRGIGGPGRRGRAQPFACAPLDAAVDGNPTTSTTTVSSNRYLVHNPTTSTTTVSSNRYLVHNPTTSTATVYINRYLVHSTPVQRAHRTYDGAGCVACKCYFR